MSVRLERSQSEMRNTSRLTPDPYGQLVRRKRFDEELNSIRCRSRSIWLRPDTALTTTGHYFVNPEQSERTLLRPTSTGRRHNPHPKLVFMRTGMREIPNAYGAPPALLQSREKMSKEISTVPNYFEQIQDLNPVEQQGVNAFLKIANEDSKAHVVQAVNNFRVLMSNDYECPPIGARSVSREDGSRTDYYPSMERFRQALQNDNEYTAINQVLENPEHEIQITDNQPPPSIIKRNVRHLNRSQSHFQRDQHSHPQCPWPLARRPYRGDYSIHSDWHPRLPHHRLTCLC